MSIAGIILAGGASRRMGSRKPLIEYKGETFLGRLARIFAESCDPVIVVLGADAERIREQAGNLERVTFVLNDDWERGQLTSLQVGLRATPAGTRAVLFTPVDYPGIKSETVAAMTRAWSEASKGSLMIQPRYEGRHGHPVLFDSRLIEDFLALGPDCQARDVVHKYVPDTLYIDVDDYGVTHDVDDPRAYMELLRADGHAL